MDALKKRNPIQVSQRFISYFEKYRIYELFQELSMMLLIKKPQDHLLFLKQSLYNAARRLDAPRIIIFAPPAFDKFQLAEVLKERLIVPIITLNEIAENKHYMSIADSKAIIANLKMFLLNYMRNNYDGWIFLDFPRNDKEARYFQLTGIIPTHVIEIISSDAICNLSRSNPNIPMSDYQRTMRGLRRVFNNSLTKVDIKGKDNEKIVDECLHIVKQKPFHGARTTFRMLLIDSVDSKRCKRLGRLLAQEYGVILIDFKDILESTCLQDTDLGDALRKLRQKTKSRVAPIELKLKVLENYLLKSGGLRRGWILIEFVTNVKDFKNLDLTDTPPNRIIVIVPKKKTEETKLECGCQPEDDFQTCIDQEATKEVIKYAGESCHVVQDHDDVHVLKDRIDTFMMSPPPSLPPRIVRPAPVIEPDDIEYDPDDEPDPESLLCIREPEPTLPLL